MLDLKVKMICDKFIYFLIKKQHTLFLIGVSCLFLQIKQTLPLFFMGYVFIMYYFEYYLFLR